MGILEEAVNEQAYLKAGIFGTAGSGKTTTASHLAIAMAHKLSNGKPVAFFETEAGSDFLIERFKVEGIKLLRKKSHALSDLLEVAKEAEKTCSVLIVDSISHVWSEVMEAKLRAVNRAREMKARKEGWKFYPVEKLEFQHYADIKREWAKWTAAFLNTSMHIIVCGRAGNVWEYETNEETGKKELQKGASKMKAEGEFGYEPSLLIEMERVQKGNTPGAGWTHRAHILKDRTDTINGKAFNFERPKTGYKKGDWSITFKPFEPVFSSLNIGGVQKTYDATRTSEDLFPGDDGEGRVSKHAQIKTITIEEIDGALDALFPGTAAAAKQTRALIGEVVFGVRSRTAFEKTIPLERLQIGLKVIRELEAAIKGGREFVDPEEMKGFLLKAAENQAKADFEGEKPVEDDLPESFTATQETLIAN